MTRKISARLHETANPPYEISHREDFCLLFRYCPDPLGIVAAQQLDKLEFGGQWPLTMRARCSAFPYCPDPLGIVTAKQLDKLEFTYCNTPQLLHR